MGVFGGSVHESMADLVYVLNSLADKTGKILIPGVNDTVKPVTDEELASYGPIDFDLEEYKKDVGVEKLLKSTKQEILMNRWRFPSLSIHGIEGACDDGAHSQNEKLDRINYINGTKVMAAYLHELK